MTGLAPAVGVAWGVLVLVAGWRRRPPPGRVRALTRLARGRTGPPAFGAALVAALAALAGRVLRRPVSVTGARRAGLAVLVVALSLPVAAPLGLTAAVAVFAVPLVQARRARRRYEAAVRRSLPEVADLFVVAVGAGLTVHLAVAAVAQRAAGPVADALRRVVDEVALGRRLADALAEVPDRVGEATRPLVAALVAADRYGGPLLDRLARLAEEARADSRRRAEEAARRVPVTLLFPLVFCTLPAFALLTVAPMLAGGLRSLRP
jgi:pilus assembly protein TadC